MKILEIKNNLIKISYDIDDNLALSGFVIIEDANCPYVAQIISLKADSAINTAIVKLLFTFDSEGVLKNYNGTIPSIKAQISKLPANELLDVLPVEVPIKLGALAQQNIPLFVDKSVFEHNLVVCSNKQENTNFFIQNMLPQLAALKQKTVLIDVDGEFEYDSKFNFGYDFKLPLNYNTLNYIFDHDLEDVDAKSKAVIQDIFYEVQEYSKTLPHQFIPFNTFLEVVDSQYRETQIPELVLLKNKLLKYKDDNVFALNSVEITDLVKELTHNDTVVLNISKTDGDLQRQVIYYLYEVMSTIKAPIYCMVKLDNYNASKKLIKRMLSGGNIQTTFICGHEFKYLPELKQVADNLILFAPLTVQHDFAAYNTYLAKLNPEEFVVYGDSTQEIPFIVALEEFSQEDLQPRVYYEEQPKKPQVNEVTEQTEQTQNESVEDLEQEEEVVEPEQNLSFTDVQVSPGLDLADTAEIPSSQEIPVFTETEIAVEQEIPVVAEAKPPVFTEQQAGIPEITETQNVEEPVESTPVVEYSEEVKNEEDFSAPQADTSISTDEFLNLSNNNDDVIVTPLESPAEQPEPAEIADIPPVPPVQEPVVQEETVNEEQIILDVDSLLYNKKDADEAIPPLEDDEVITEDDLNVIDNLNNSAAQVEEKNASDEPAETSQEPVIVEDPQEQAPQEFAPQVEPLPETEVQDEEIVEESPVVPVYPANDIPEVSPEIFEAGDKVSHPKYGTGVVEKMIKYGNKVLCSINFENIGRRLLDPAISEITKVN